MTLNQLLNVTEITRRVHISKVALYEGDDSYTTTSEQIAPKPLLFPDVLLSYLQRNKPEVLDAEVIMVSYRFWDDGKPFLDYIIK